MAEQDFEDKIRKLQKDFGQSFLGGKGLKGLAGAGKAVGRKSMPKISITIDEEFRLPDEFGGQRLEDEEDDFPLSDSPLWSGAKTAGGKAAKRALEKSKRAQRLEDEKKKKEKD
jgi:hypothetical protein